MPGVAWAPAEMDVSIKPEIIEIGVDIEIQATIHGNPETPPVVTLTQEDKAVRSEMKEEPDVMFMAEYTAILRTKDFKPGMAQLTVSGSIGEEEIVYNQELLLEKTTAVEGMDDATTGSGDRSTLRNTLHKSFPNPFNPDVWIPFEIGHGARVTVEIYNSSGQLIRTLDLGYKFPGRYMDISKAAHWDGRNSHGEQVPSGIYFYKLQAGDFIAMGKMIAVK
jgi:hypothetical protein